MKILFLMSLICVATNNAMDVVASSSSASTIEYIQVSDSTPFMPTLWKITTETKEEKNKKWVRSDKVLVWDLLLACKKSGDSTLKQGQLYDALVQRKIDSETQISHPVVVYFARDDEKVAMISKRFSEAFGEKVYVLSKPVPVKEANPQTLYVVYGKAIKINGHLYPLDTIKIIQESPFAYKP